MGRLIELADQDYQYCLDYANGKTNTMALNNVNRIIKAVADSTPIPKGHGRLLIISEDSVKENMIGLDAFQQKFIGEVDLSNAIVGVIEANKENEDGSN